MKIALIVLLILLLILLVLVIYMLVVPFRVMIHTGIGTYKAKWGPLVSADIAEEADQWNVRVHFPGWVNRYPLEDMLFRRRQPVKAKRVHKESERPGTKKKAQRPSFQRMLRVLGQIRIHEFSLDLDSDDVIFNAYLFPAFEGVRFWTRGKCRTRVNFIGRNELRFNAQVRMFNLLRAAYL